MKYQIYRTNSSTYQKADFFNLEKSTIEAIGDIRYIKSLTSIDSDTPFILITNTHTNTADIPTKILENTKLVIHPNSGHDNFKLEFIKNASFPIIVGNEIRAAAVCEYILGIIFREICAIPSHYHWSIDRSWNRPLLKSKKILLLGHGHIGKVLFQSLKPLAGEISVFDPYINRDEYPQVHTDWSDSLLQDVDILICSASLNAKNKGFIDQDKLKHLVNEAIIINPSRGEIFNEADLIRHAEKNPKSKIYMDVFEHEPFPPGYLNQLSNINKTSHIAGVSKNLGDLIIEFEKRVILDFLQMDSNSFHTKYAECDLRNRVRDDFIY